MKLYRVPIRDDKKDESKGYRWFTNHREAVKCFKARSDKEIDFIEKLTVPKTKKEMIDFLNNYGGYPDNGWAKDSNKRNKTEENHRRKNHIYYLHDNFNYVFDIIKIIFILAVHK